MFYWSTVVRGNIQTVEEDENLRAAVIKVSATRVFRQKYALFTSNGRLTSKGEIRTLLQCGVKPGPGSFLFTGRVHFGEAWLGCAPRYKDFQRAYTVAKAAQQIPCELPVDWVTNSAAACLSHRIKAVLQARPNSAPFHVSEETTTRNCRSTVPWCHRWIFPKVWGVKWTFPTPFQCNMQPPCPKDLVEFWHEVGNEDYKHLALDGFGNSDAIVLVQRKCFEKLSIWDKLS